MYQMKTTHFSALISGQYIEMFQLCYTLIKQWLTYHRSTPSSYLRAPYSSSGARYHLNKFINKYTQIKNKKIKKYHLNKFINKYTQIKNNKKMKINNNVFVLSTCQFLNQSAGDVKNNFWSVKHKKESCFLSCIFTSWFGLAVRH